MSARDYRYYPDYDGCDVSASNIRAWIEAGLRSLGKIKDKDEVSELGIAGTSIVNGVPTFLDPRDAGLSLGSSEDDNWKYQITWKRKKQKGVELVKSGAQL